MPQPAFPFEALLTQLRSERFAIGVDSWLRVASLLEKCDGGIEPSRLRTVLCPLFASNPEEQKRFAEIFDGYFSSVAPPDAEKARTIARVAANTPSRVKWFWKAWYWKAAAVSAVFACTLGFGLVWEWREKPTPLGGQVRPRNLLSPRNERKTGVGPPAPPVEPARKVSTPPMQVKITIPDTGALDRWRIVWLVPAVLAAIYVLWYLARRVAGGFLVRQSGAGALPSWSRTAAVRAPIVRAPEVSQNVRRLRRPSVTATTRLAVGPTLEATLRNAGFPKIRFQLGTRRTEYLVLIDRVSTRDHEAELFNQLVATLREDGQLAVEQYFFTRDPRVCVSAKTGNSAYLADLLPRVPAHRLLLFGDGAALWNSITGERAPWADMLLDRPQTALMTPNTGGWDAREHALSRWTLVRPATLEGLSSVLDAFEERPDRMPPPAATRTCPEYPALESCDRVAAYVAGLRDYLEDDEGAAGVFDLVCACALYPRLEWDLTMHLAAELNPALLDHAVLLKVASLPWFRSGFYPVALQEQLFHLLPRKLRGRLRRKIVALIDAGTKQAVQQASLELVVQRFDLSPAERQELESNEVFARLSRLASRSRTGLRIPESVRRALFQFGVPGFGLRRWALASLALAALTGVVAAVTVLPPTGSLEATVTVPAPPENWAIPAPRAQDEFPPSAFKPSTTGFTAPQLAQLYNFPPELDGTGQTIGIIELGGGYKDSDLDAYFNGLKIHRPKITWVSVDGGKNAPSGPNGADGQVEGDIEIAGSVAPGAQIVVYFAPNTGFLKVFEAAINDQERNPSVISIGWGGTEDTTQLEVEAINKLLQTASSKGITVCAASGDTGATDGRSDGKPHVDFPASSPWVLAVGGTHLLAAGGLIGSEVAWNSMQASVGGATGGGVSTIFPLPDWQKNAKVPLNPNGNAGRGLPDVAANADPTTGYQVYVDGQEMLIGGTSMSTPLWAGLIALLNQGLGRNIGFLNPVLYQKLGPAGILRSITQGNNRVANVGYSAGPGWNPVTGWGSPDGRKLLEALRSPQPPAPRKVRGVSAQ